MVCLSVLVGATGLGYSSDLATAFITLNALANLLQLDFCIGKCRLGLHELSFVGVLIKFDGHDDVEIRFLAGCPVDSDDSASVAVACGGQGDYRILLAE